MRALIAAARAALENDSAVNTLTPGGFHAGRAPAGAEMPYAVMTHNGGARADYDTAGTAVSLERMTFEIFAESAEGAAEAAERVVAVFESSPPALETGACLAAGRLTGSLTIEAGPGPDGADVWRGAVEIEFMVERPAL